MRRPGCQPSCGLLLQAAGRWASWRPWGGCCWWGLDQGHLPPTSAQPSSSPGGHLSTSYTVGKPAPMCPHAPTRLPQGPVSVSAPPCLYLPISAPPCLYLPISALPCLYLPVSAPPCLYLPVSAPPCLYLPVSAPPCLYLSISAPPCLYLPISVCLCVCFVSPSLSLVSVSLLLSHVPALPGPQEDTSSGSSSPTRHGPS